MPRMLSPDTRLSNLIPPTNFPPDLWELLTSREAAQAAVAFTDTELPAAAGLSGLLVEQMPDQVDDPQFRMTVGYGLRRVMEHLGHDLAREDVQINLPGIFSTGAVYVRRGLALRDRSQRIRRADRTRWAEARKPC